MQRLIQPALLLVLAFGCAAGLLHALGALSAKISLDPNEGWNAYHALAMRGGGPLYPPADSLFVNNYPPLSFVLIGVLGGVLGDDIIAGRVVSLMALGTVLAGVIAALRILRVDWASTLFAALFLLGGLLLFSDYVGMDDPQMLGHALSMGALVLVLRGHGQRLAVVLAALLCALAFFVKHNLVVLPVSLTLWLFFYAQRTVHIAGFHVREKAVLFASTYALLVALGLVLTKAIFAVDLLSVLASPRGYSAALLGANLETWLAFGLIPILILVWLIWNTRRSDAAVWLVAIYVAAALAAGIYFFGGAGVDANAMFDADIALALGLGLALHRLPRRDILAVLALLPLAFGLMRAYEPAWARASFWLHPFADEKASARDEIAFLRARPGPALCQTLALCYWASKPAAVDVFNLNEAFRLKARSAAPLRARIETTQFAVVQLEDADALGADVAAALAAHYRAHHTGDNGLFLVPR